MCQKKSAMYEIVNPHKKPQEFFSIFKNMDYMITMRLHSMIFAYRLGIPFSGISYDIKCDDFLKSIGKHNTNFNEIGSLKLK